MKFKLQAPFVPTGDQPEAIKQLIAGVEADQEHQVLLGVTGSGKSLGYDDPVFIVEEKDGKKIPSIVPIGSLIDTSIEKPGNSVSKLNDTEILDLDKSKICYFTQAYDPATGTVALFPIQSFIRHQSPKDMYHLQTQCGRSVTLTGDHNLWVLREGQLKLITTTEAQQTDYVPVPEFLLSPGKLTSINLIAKLNSKKLFVEASEVIQSFIKEKGGAAFVAALPKDAVKSPYSKLHAIRFAKKGQGIQIATFKYLLSKTDNLAGHFDLKKAKISARSKNHCLPVELQLTESCLHFMGYYLAEGCATDRYLVLANDQPIIRSGIEKFLAEIQTPFHVRKSSDYQISSLALVELMKQLFGNNAFDKHLPDFWTQLAEKDLGKLLSAYYDGDGTISKNGEIITATASQKLASDVTYALLKFGIWARIKKKWKRATNTNHKGNWYYYVYITGQTHLRRFNDSIGFSVAHKQVRLASFLTKVENTNRDTIPGVGKYLCALRKKLLLSQTALCKNNAFTRNGLSLIESNLRAPSRTILSKLLITLENESLKQQNDNPDWWNTFHSLKKLVAVHWTPIKSIEKIEYNKPFVYDFSVPQAETFLAGQGGLFVHNTFTMANVIEKIQRPTLIMAHNKTLAAQLYQEFRDFFPENAVSYFVSYYDYYQPEAYIPSSDTYIEKEATINDEIDKLRLATTTNLLTRQDVIVVASVSCIYNLGSPVEYGQHTLELMEGEIISRETLMLQMSNLQYERSDADLRRGTFRLRGDIIQIWPASEDSALKIETLENKITKIDWINPVTGSAVVHPMYQKPVDVTGTTPTTPSPKRYTIYPAKHYVLAEQDRSSAFAQIQHDLDTRVAEMKAEGKVIEAYRLQQKVNHDLDMLKELGYVNGVENYSRYFDGRAPGDPPFTLLDYFKACGDKFTDGKFLTFIDESHITLPQVRGMYYGDRSRKETLINYGFRLPSALDNRPLISNEFMQRLPQAVYVSATPEEYEVSLAGGKTVEQLIRPTGLIDPPITIRPIERQIEDLVVEVIARKNIGQRSLVTTLTKRMAEALTDYLNNPEKITALVKDRLAQVEGDKDQDTSQNIRLTDGFLPIDTMEIGPIPPELLHATQYLTPLPDPNNIEFPKVAYLHSDIETLERSDILADLRKGEYDIVVGINLLREGLDLPEVSLVAILDADKEGFLRSRTSLIQTMGRAARHVDGQVILYADKLTKSMKAAIQETQRRRAIQMAHNTEHGITPMGINKPIRERMTEKKEDEASEFESEKDINGKHEPMMINLNKLEQIDLAAINAADLTPNDRKRLAVKLRRRMQLAAKELDYELATILRDKIATLE